MSNSILAAERRKATAWIVAAWIGIPLMFAGAFTSVTRVPSKWDHAIALGVCGSFPILQLEDGSMWLRKDGFRIYRIENLERLKCPS